MLASLAMYDFEGYRDHWNALYAPIADALPYAPRELKWGDGALDWSQPIFLTMLCGAPYRNHYADRLHLIGTLDFGIIDGRPGYYNSAIVGEVAQQGRTRLAVNDRGSQSGYHAVVKWLQHKGADFEIVETGAHIDSLRAIRDGRADLCGIDAVSYRFITELNADLAALPELARSEPTPGLPLATDDASIVQELRSIIAAQLPNAALGIRGLADITHDDYVAISNATNP